VGKNQKLKIAKKAAEKALLKIDLGCGKNVREGFTGVDVRDFGQKVTADLTKKWPWKDGSVDEAHCSHFIEHLDAEERIHFVNELYRVLKPGAQCQVVVPHWASQRAYGDLTHKWPPVAEFWFYYLSKEWRAINAPHNDGYACDFEVTWGYSLHPALASRNQEYQQNALSWWKEAAQDTVANFKKRVAKP
jgi:SAM-dependent methyltransferase